MAIRGNGGDKVMTMPWASQIWPQCCPLNNGLNVLQIIQSVASKLGFRTKKTCSNRAPDMTCFVANHLKFDSH